MSQDEALLITTALAAVAAGASAVSAFQARKIARAATLPDVSIQVIITEIGASIGRVGAVVHNAGNGVARGLHFMLIADGTVSSNYGPGGGILRADDALMIETTIQVRMPMDEDAFALVGCRDREGFTHVWTNKEQHRRLRSRWLPFRPGRHKNLAEYVRRRHRIDTAQLDTASSTVVREGA